MRITNGMISARVIYNTQSTLARFMKTQTEMSSGRRINTPSDDPIGTLRDLDYREELSKNSQFQKNINMAQNWVQTYDNVLDNMNQIANSARELSVTMSNGSITTEARKGAVSEIQPLIEQLLQLSNEQQEGRSIFSGFQTDQDAFRKYTNGFRYMGDDGVIRYQINNSTQIDVNLTGSSVLTSSVNEMGTQADYNPALMASTLLSDLHNGQGIDMTTGQFIFSDKNMGIDVTVNIHGSMTVSDALFRINNALVVNGITNASVAIGETGNSLVIDTTENGLISGFTNIENLNSGYGVDLDSYELLVSDGGLFNASIDFSGVSTVSELIAQFNSQTTSDGVPNMTMQINAAGTGLEIIDGNGHPLGLTVSDTSGTNELASALGLVGNIDPTLVGDDLNPKLDFVITEDGGTTADDLGLIGSFNGDFVGKDLDPALLLTTSVADLNNGQGLPSGEIELWQGEYQRVIDLNDSSIITVQDMLDVFNNSGLDITASLNPDGRGIQIVNNDPTRSFTIEEIGDGRMAKELEIFGATDFVGSLFVLQNSLESDNQEEVGLLIEHFDNSINHLLNMRAKTGTRGIRLETTANQLIEQHLMYTQRLSEIEDADLTKVITDLATYENNYQASLMATASIIQPSLLNFLK